MAASRRAPRVDPTDPLDARLLTLPGLRERFPATSEPTLRLLYMAFADAARRRERDALDLRQQREELALVMRQHGTDLMRAANDLTSGNPGLGRLGAARVLAASALRAFARAESLATFAGKHDLVETASALLSSICTALGAKRAPPPAEPGAVAAEPATSETTNAGEKRAEVPS